LHAFPRFHHQYKLYADYLSFSTVSPSSTCSEIEEYDRLLSSGTLFKPTDAGPVTRNGLLCLSSTLPAVVGLVSFRYVDNSGATSLLLLLSEKSDKASGAMVFNKRNSGNLWRMVNV
jgi:hypothetical protein